jgi:Sec-independent protein translocase protein TatA
MTALWISLAGVVVMLFAWRLRKAGKTVDRILREERERTEQESAVEGTMSTVERGKR